MSFNSTLADGGGGGGAVTFMSPLQEDSPATAIIVITRLRARVTRIDIDLIIMVFAVFTRSFALGGVLYRRVLFAAVGQNGLFA
jgi:hypothetical protein